MPGAAVMAFWLAGQWEPAPGVQSGVRQGRRPPGRGFSRATLVASAQGRAVAAAGESGTVLHLGTGTTPLRAVAHTGSRLRVAHGSEGTVSGRARTTGRLKARADGERRHTTRSLDRLVRLNADAEAVLIALRLR